MVRDIAEGNAAHILETFWHFEPNLAVRQTGDRFVVADQNGDEPHQITAFVPVTDSQWDCRITAGEGSPVYGVAGPAQSLRCRADMRLPAEHAMVVRSLSVEHEAPGELVRVKTQAAQAAAPGVTVYEYRENGRTHFLIFRDAQGDLWNFGDWASDAAFLYYCAEAQRISHLVACHATFIKYRSEALVSVSRRVERFEYWERDGKRQVSSSDREALTGFSDSMLASWDAGVVG